MKKANLFDQQSDTNTLAGGEPMKRSQRGVRSSLGRLLSGAISTGVLLSLAALPALAQPRPLLTHHARTEVLQGQAAFVRPLPAAQTMRLNIALPLRNLEELGELAEKINDPESPSYHQFLTVEEFTERFGPTREDYDAVVHFAQENGLTVTGLSQNRHLVDVAGPVSAVEKAFHVNMGMYQHPTENRTFFAPDQEPTADLPFALWHITGLDNFSIPHPASMSRDEVHTSNATGSGPGGQFIGSDFRAAYYGGSKLTGSGQSVGLLEFAGYNIKDVNTYFSKVKQKRTVTVKGVSTDGSSLSCTGKCDDGEQVIDIEVAISMAPGMKDLYVYVSDTSDVSIFNRMASDNLAKQLSCSWVWAPEDQLSDEPIFLEFVVQGQTLFASSGDSGAYNSKNHTYPAEDPLVIAVGGTDLTTNGAGGSWKSETGWSGSGGGISPDKIGIPSFQMTKGVITKANKGSTKYRNLPDVAAEANNDNYVCLNGTCQSGWGGTSFAAPRWAGYLALVNQQSVSKGKGTVGFITPTLYTLGLGSTHAADFHDITSGSNGTYSCTKGYDLVTGWGSPHGTGLINALAP